MTTSTINLSQLSGQFWNWITSYSAATNGWVNDQESIISGAYTPTTVANLYPQSMAVIVAVNIGDITTAETIINNLATMYPTSGFVGMYNGIHSNNSTKDTTSDRYISNNAWFLLALCHYANSMTGTAKQYKYKTLADTIATWITTFQDIPGNPHSYYNDNGFYGGLHSDSTLINTKIQEANVSCIAALRAHSTYYGGSYLLVSSAAQAFLLSKGGGSGYTGLRNGNAFFAGKWDNPNHAPAGYDTTNYLDNTCWASIMIQDSNNFSSIIAGFNSITYQLISSNVTDVNPAAGSLAGYADASAKNRVFVEGWAYVALCNYKSYILTKAQSYLAKRNSLLSNYNKVLIPSKNFQGQGVPIMTNSGDYTGATTSLSSEAVLWFLMAEKNINPFDPSQFTPQQYSDVTNPFQTK